MNLRFTRLEIGIISVGHSEMPSGGCGSQVVQQDHESSLFVLSSKEHRSQVFSFGTRYMNRDL